MPSQGGWHVNQEMQVTERGRMKVVMSAKERAAGSGRSRGPMIPEGFGGVRGVQLGFVHGPSHVRLQTRFQVAAYRSSRGVGAFYAAFTARLR